MDSYSPLVPRISDCIYPLRMPASASGTTLRGQGEQHPPAPRPSYLDPKIPTSDSCTTLQGQEDEQTTTTKPARLHLKMPSPDPGMLLQGHKDEQTTTIQQSMSSSPPLSEPSPSEPVEQSVISRAKKHLFAPVRPSGLAELQLLILTFCTGIQDAISFPDYHCFASNQTGNTVFLAVAIAVPDFNGDMFFTPNIGVALGLFLAGAYLTGQLSHIVGPRVRAWLVLCNLVQTALVFAAAAIQHAHGVHRTGPLDLTVLALLAFASGSQVVQSRSLRMTEISTAMATAAWVDLLVDPHLLAARTENRPRNRRLAFLVTLFLGSLVGAFIYKSAGSAVAIYESAAGKALVTAMYFFTPSQTEKVNQGAV